MRKYLSSCVSDRGNDNKFLHNKKSEKKQNWWPNVFTKKFTLSLRKHPAMFLSLFDSFLVLCFAVSFSQPQKSEFFQIKRARENTNLARRKKFFSSSLLSGAERERERESRTTLS